jgi:hypothetical protein
MPNIKRSCTVKRLNLVIKFGASLVITMMVFAPYQALAITNKDLHSIIYDSVFFDPTGKEGRIGGNQGNCVPPGPAGDPPPPGDLEANAEWIFRFFVSQGLTPIQAVGIMGNLKAESGMDPDAREPNGIGYGIAQWSFGRRDALEAAAAEQGVPVSDLAFQANYLVNESMGRDSRSYPGITEWEGLKRQEAVRDAVFYWEHNFERPEHAGQEIRVTYAQEYLDRFGSDTPTPGPGPAPNQGGGCGNPGPGQGQIVGDPYTDSSDVPCAEGTTEVGQEEGWISGESFPITLCSLPNLPSSGSTDNGYARVNSRVSGAWFNLVNDAAEEGINFSAVSSFRTMAHQQSLWNSNPDPTWVARPGYSSHQAGVAIDFADMSARGGSSCESRAEMRDNPAWLWLYNNAETYGFKQYAPEAWHWDALPEASTRCGGP